MTQTGDTGGGYGGTAPPGGLCQISIDDLIGYVGNLWTTVRDLEAKVAQLSGANVSAIYVSDITDDFGNIVNGVIGPAVIIHTTQDYAMYAYGTIDPTPLQVEGTITVTDSHYSISNAYSLVPSLRTIYDHFLTFQISKPGVYIVLVSAVIEGEVLATHGVSYTTLIEAGNNGTLPTGLNNRGKYKDTKIVIAQQGGAGTLDIMGAYGDANNGGVSAHGFFRCTDGNEQIYVEIVPTVDNYIAADFGVQINALCVSVMKIADV